MPLTMPRPQISSDELDRIAAQTEAENRVTGLSVSGKKRPEPVVAEDSPVDPKQPQSRPEPTLPDWRVHAGRCKAEPDPATQKHGMLAVLEFRSSAGRGPSVLHQLFTQPVSDAVLKAVDSTRATEYLNKLRPQLAEAEKRLRLATAQLAKLRGEREALVIAAEPGLAKRLQAVDVKLEEWETKRSEAEGELSTLEPVIQKALAEAEAAIEPAFFTASTEVKQAIAAKRTALLDRVLGLVAPLLNEMASLDAAANGAHVEKGSIIATAKAHLRSVPSA
jgi:hypothetical protein